MVNGLVLANGTPHLPRTFTPEDRESRVPRLVWHPLDTGNMLVQPVSPPPRDRATSTHDMDATMTTASQPGLPPPGEAEVQMKRTLDPATQRLVDAGPYCGDCGQPSRDCPCHRTTDQDRTHCGRCGYPMSHCACHICNECLFPGSECICVIPPSPDAYPDQGRSLPSRQTPRATPRRAPDQGQHSSQAAHAASSEATTTTASTMKPATVQPGPSSGQTGGSGEPNPFAHPTCTLCKMAGCHEFNRHWTIACPCRHEDSIWTLCSFLWRCRVAHGP